MRLEIHPAATAEVEQEANYYDAKSFGLGQAFLHELEVAVAKAKRFPTLYAADHEGLRRCHLHRFPFTVVFRIKDAVMEILVVRHNARHPDYGLERLSPDNEDS